MSSDRRFEQDLPGLLDDLYLGSMPTYRDQVLQQTARTRQRPAWSFAGRWIPMADIARQPVLVPRLPWRTIGLGLVLIALLVALVTALAIGGHRNLPAPFGLARNGLVAFATAGDIYAVDPSTGSSRAIVTGPETDLNPRYSLDGTRFAFQRQAQPNSTSGLVYVAQADGSDPVQVTPLPLVNIANYDFSPDGTELLISAPTPRIAGSSLTGSGLYVAATDGSRIRELDLGMSATNAVWRPPDGSEILFMDSGDESNGFGGIYLVSAQGGPVRTILADASASDRHRSHPLWSPDGSLIAFAEWANNAPSITVQVHVMAADGTREDRVLPLPGGAQWQSLEAWSNDGTRLLAFRGYTGGPEAALPAAIPVDGSGTGIEIPYPGGIQPNSPTAWQWAPDDSSILGTPTDTTGLNLDQVLLDPVKGTSLAIPWKSASLASWQRLAP